jgi:hypothetical protein
MMHITFRHFQSRLDFARNWFWAVACVCSCFIIHLCTLSKTNTLIMRQVCYHQAHLRSLSFAFFSDPSKSIFIWLLWWFIYLFYFVGDCAPWDASTSHFSERVISK